MNKYEEAKVQVKAREIADRVLEMDDKQYQRFVGNLQAEINMLNAGVEVADEKLKKLEGKKFNNLAEGDDSLIVLAGGVVGCVAGIIACANKLAPIDFVDALIMGSSAMGSFGLGIVGGAVATAMIEGHAIGKGVNAIQKHIQKKKLAKLNAKLSEKDTIMDEICEAVIARDMGM